MKDYKILEVVKEENSDNASLWIAEAIFGFNNLHKYLNTLRTDANILEVGCGSGILLSMLAEAYSQYNFFGLEPFGDGFSNLREINSTVRKMGVNIEIEGYEYHTSKYDLIYCVNVFEHVNDWRDFLNWAHEHLNHDGVFVVLCPNYGFPYESHFKIPIILNKAITYAIFEKYLTEFENKNDCNGLWKSLNFVKKRDILKHCKKNFTDNEFSCFDDISIIDSMIERLSTDAEFKDRQFFIGKLAKILRYIGAIALVKRFPNYLPYMKLHFRKLK